MKSFRNIPQIIIKTVGVEIRGVGIQHYAFAMQRHSFIMEKIHNFPAHAFRAVLRMHNKIIGFEIFSAP